MRLLAIDTATEALSVALLDGPTVLERYEVIGRGHAEQVLPWIDALLAEAGYRLRDLDGIAVGRGPGAFTGVRIGISVVQGLAFGADLPVLGISNLAAVGLAALQAARAAGVTAGSVVVAMDARMGEIYAARGVAAEAGVALEGEWLLTPAALAAQATGSGDGTVLAGHGFAAYPALAAAWPAAVATYPDLLPRARVIGQLAEPLFAAGRGVAAEALEPVYLRDNVATKSEKVIV